MDEMIAGPVRGSYHVDMWDVVRQRWMVAGVLAALALAVLVPWPGAQGGILSSQYTWYLPQSYIYFCAGRRGVRGGGRLLLVGCAHAALVAPALAVLLLASTSNDVHYTLVQGVLMSSVGSGCGWLSLALSNDAAAAPLTATSYFVSLLTTPLAMILLCGRAVLPAPSTVALTCLPAFGAWMAGTAWTARAGSMGGERSECTARICALVLLYMECCEGLALRGSVRLGDLMAVLLLEASWLGMGAGACWGYARCGLLPADDARTLALCALPKGAHVGWHSSLSCISAALAQLPGICLAPAQALLLAAIAPPTPSDQPRVELN